VNEKGGKETRLTRLQRNLSITLTDLKYWPCPCKSPATDKIIFYIIQIVPENGAGFGVVGETICERGFQICYRNV